MREVVAECEKPVMLYSIGKDSSVMLHLAMKAFHPAKPPFPLLHVDTTWKFREMIAFRDATVQEAGPRPAGAHEPGGPRARHQTRSRTARRAYRRHEDAGAAARRSTSTASTPPSAARAATRRSRAPRSASSRFRNSQHRWDPKNQRPELWKLYNARKHKGEIAARVPAVQLDRAGHLAVHPPARTSRSCRSTSRPSARWWSATAR